VATYKKITFVIDGFTPLTLPIGRLADYIKNFAALVGPNSEVRFQKVAEGSAALISRAPEESIPEVRARIIAAKNGDGQVDAIRGFAGIRAMLAQDRTTGRIRESGHRILEFPKPRVPQYGAISEDGALEGVLIKIGGRDETIPVHLQDGEKFYKCQTTRAKAKELAPFLFGDPIRVIGKGKWTRSEIGAWEMTEFKISDFERLNNDEIQQVLERLRQIPGSGWDKIDDPLSELDRIRKGTGKIQ
jgi:hypothetical protein